MTIMQTEALPLPKVYGLKGVGRFLQGCSLTLYVLLCISTFGVMVPSVYQFLSQNVIPTSQPLTIAILTFAAAIMSHVYLFYDRFKLEVSQEGLTYHHAFYSLYTPWENLLRGDFIDTRPFRALKLQTSAVFDTTLKQGREKHIAAVELRGPARNKRFQKNFPADVFPLDIITNNWQEHEIGTYLREHAPQLFEQIDKRRKPSL